MEGLTCADPGARTPIGASGNFLLLLSSFLSMHFLNIYIYLSKIINLGKNSIFLPGFILEAICILVRLKPASPLGLPLIELLIF